MTDITTRNLAFILVFKIFLVIGLFANINLKEARIMRLKMIALHICLWNNHDISLGIT